jgi:hypothetical protein
MVTANNSTTRCRVGPLEIASSIEAIVLPTCVTKLREQTSTTLSSSHHSVPARCCPRHLCIHALKSNQQDMPQTVTTAFQRYAFVSGRLSPLVHPDSCKQTSEKPSNSDDRTLVLRNHSLRLVPSLPKHKFPRLPSKQTQTCPVPRCQRKARGARPCVARLEQC